MTSLEADGLVGGMITCDCSFGRLINGWHRPFFGALQNAPEAGPLASRESIGGMVEKKKGAPSQGAGAPKNCYLWAIHEKVEENSSLPVPGCQV